jgi:hypothetical protein
MDSNEPKRTFLLIYWDKKESLIHIPISWTKSIKILNNEENVVCYHRWESFKKECIHLHQIWVTLASISFWAILVLTLDFKEKISSFQHQFHDFMWKSWKFSLLKSLEYFTVNNLNFICSSANELKQWNAHEIVSIWKK